MAQFDLRAGDDSLDPLSPFKVLAVMCEPTDLRAREHMMALLHVETGVGRSRRRSVSREEFLIAVRRSQRRGYLAGALLLTLLQLDETQEPASLNIATVLVSAILPDWDQPTTSEWSWEAHLDHLPTARRNLLAAFRDFRSASHLWAALLHGVLHQRMDIWPGSLETLPTFLAYSNAFAERGMALPWRGRRTTRLFTLEERKLWRFIIPSRMQRSVRLDGLPLNEEQRQILNELQARKSV